MPDAPAMAAMTTQPLFRTPADQAVVGWLHDAVGRLEEQALGLPRRRLGLFALDGVGALRAGATCVQWGTDLYLHLLWVDKDLRGSGLGGALLLAAEAEAAKRGCRRVYLNTMGFQGPYFYPRFGYRSVGVMPDFVYGHARHYFRKDVAVTDAPALPAGLVLEVTDGVPTAAEKTIEDGLTAHWLEHAPAHYTELTATLPGADGERVAALYGVIDADWFTVVELCVDPAHRGRGHARALLEATHRHVAGLGCRWSTVIPMDYQAPGLFRALGYEPRLRVEDYVLGHGRTWLRRPLEVR